MTAGPVTLEAERQRVARQVAARAAAARVVVAVAVVIAAAAVVAGAIVGVLTIWWAGIPVGAAVATAGWFIVVVTRVERAEDRLLQLVGPVRDADPHREARLLNLLDGLVPSAGVTRPRVLVIEAEEPNVLVFGRDARHGCVVATSGLLRTLDRMELEGVVAHALVTIRDGVTAGATRALAIGGARLLPLGGPPPSPADSDLEAVALTRYPPGLAGALRRLLSDGPPVVAGRASPLLDRFWLARPGDEKDLRTRAQALEEL